MIKMTLDSAKVTDRKFRWDAPCEKKVVFSLYIPQWRIPEPWPSEIFVTLDPMDTLPDGTPFLTESMVTHDPATRKQAITALLQKKKDNVHSARYEPLGQRTEWELGEPYIPYSILPENVPNNLRIIVQWGT